MEMPSLCQPYHYVSRDTSLQFPIRCVKNKRIPNCYNYSNTQCKKFTSIVSFVSTCDVCRCSFNAGLYWRVQMMDLITYGIVFVAFTIISTMLLAHAYKKTKVNMKHK